jgi:GMP synthase-like glutamine amidotransferase
VKIEAMQHVAFETPGAIEAWARARGHAFRITRSDLGQAPPAVQAGDLLVVMGGPMGVHDEVAHPWLVPEKRAIRAAIDAGAHVLGICLGAQLIAHVLGARVFANRHKEIGWWPIEWTDAARATSRWSPLCEAQRVFHWHGDTCGLPAGAEHLARTDACEHQAFALGDRVLALQFHVEMTRAGVDALLTHGAADLAPGLYVQTAAAIRAGAHELGTLHALLERWLDGWAGSAIAG